MRAPGIVLGHPITTSAWQSYIANVQPDDDEDVDVEEEVPDLEMNECYDDDDFYRKIDDEHGFITRNILCVPLRDGDERSIGVFDPFKLRRYRISNA